MADITNIVNAILDNGSTEYVNRVPVATRDNIAEVANPILTYSNVQNEFLTALLTKSLCRKSGRVSGKTRWRYLKKAENRWVLILNLHISTRQLMRGSGTGADLLTKKGTGRQDQNTLG